MENILQIIIPVYNESDNIVKTLNSLKKHVKTPYSVLLIYDFDKDNTIPVVAKYVNEQDAHNVSWIKNQEGVGALAAIKTGLKNAKYEAILVVMADCSDDFSIVDSMFAKINQGYDIICASRYMRGGKQIGGPFIKKIISRMAGVSLHHLVGLPTCDVTNSFKMYRRSVLNRLHIESQGGFEIGMEIVIKTFLSGGKITEIPSVWRPRPAGQSRFRLFKWLPKYIYWYLFALKNKWFRS